MFFVVGVVIYESVLDLVSLLKIFPAILESGPQKHDKYGLLGLPSIMVVYMDPLGDSPFQIMPLHDAGASTRVGEVRHG